MDLVLIRHGQSQWNLDQTGGEDSPLTSQGREQARRAGIYCRAQFRLAALYASTYCRAAETADIINSFIGLPEVARLEDLREFADDYGPDMPLFALPTDVLNMTTSVHPRDISPYYASFQERIQRAIVRILDAHRVAYETDAQIGIVSHGGTMGTIIRTLTGSHHFSTITENTGIHILRWEQHRWHVVALNRIEHLECDRWEHEAGRDA